MTDPSPESINLQPAYTAEESTWQDLSRIMRFIGILGSGFVLATIYLIFFLLYSNTKFSLTNQSKFVNIVALCVGFLVLILPIVLEFIELKIISTTSEKFTGLLYDIPDTIDIRPLLQKRLIGVPPVPKSLAMTITYPFILIDKDKLDEKFSWAYFLGGPAKLIIYDGYAVYLERGNKFSRVVGSGIAFLERYEMIGDIIDLRPQVRDMAIDAWSKDGIKLKVHVRLECQILSAKDAESSQKEWSQESGKRVYTFYEKAVVDAVEMVAARHNKDGQPEKYDWIAGVCGNIEGHIRSHTLSYTINDLLRIEEPDQTSLPVNEGDGTSEIQEGGLQDRQSSHQLDYFQQENHNHPVTQLLSLELRDLIQKRVNQDVVQFGARLINLQITKIEKSAIIDEQWAKNWSAEGERLNMITAGEAEAYRIRTREKAHAKAQKDMILAITEGLENMDPREMREPLLLSLSGMLENSLVDSYVRASLPKEALETLEKIQEYLK